MAPRRISYGPMLREFDVASVVIRRVLAEDAEQAKEIHEEQGVVIDSSIEDVSEVDR